MRNPLPHVAASLLLVALLAATGAAQVPTTEQAQQMLQNPDLVGQLRDRLNTSGLTPDQVRARLTAEGYPATLLDAYLPGGSAAARDSLPGDDVLNAMRALGVADSSDIEGLRGSIGQMRRGGARRTPTTAAPPNLATAAARSAPSERIFGLDVFRSTTSEFQPSLSGPVDANYRLGPGDQLVLILTGDVEFSRTLDVTREGFVLIPQVGQIPVANLTLSALETVLYTRLGRVYSGVRRQGGTTHFSVTVSKLRVNQVFVNGDADRPGSYRISGAGTALTALYAAGGPSDIGSMRKISIRRGGKTIAMLDVYDYLLRGEAGGDIRLENDDIVFVPVHGPRVRIAGEVNRPAIYELKDGETLADLVASAGGLSATAGHQRLQIERIVPPSQRTGAGRDRVMLEVTSDQLASGNVPALRVEAGDVVRVEPIDKRVRSLVKVTGNVWLPGAQGFTPGLTLSQALRGAGGAKPDSYLGQVLVSRLRPDSTREQLRATLSDTTGAVLGVDPALRDDDEITVFSRTEFRSPRYVAISGGVRKPGQYPYREGISVRDLVLLAGGLQENASLKEAEIARLPADRTNGVTAHTMRVPLDSSYIFDRGPDGRYLGPPGLPAPAGPGPETVLQPYDNVLILLQPDWKYLRTVSVTGEVRYPGRYTLENKSERIDDLIRRAGGLTAEANTDGAYFSRRHSAASYIGLIDSARAKADTAIRVGLDLPDAMRDSKDPDNLLLENGDSLDLPTRRTTVEIKGAVNAPTIVAAERGEKLEFYIRSAGGPSRIADAKAAFVIQPNGRIESRHRVALIFRSDPTARGGATIIVPVKDTVSRATATLTNFSIISGIIATLITALAVIKK